MSKREKDTFKTDIGTFEFEGRLKKGTAFVARIGGVECVIICKSFADLRRVWERSLPPSAMRLQQKLCRNLKFGAAENFTPQPEASK